MKTQEIARRLVEICRTGEFKKAQQELFAEDAVVLNRLHRLDLRKKQKVSRLFLKKVKNGIQWCRRFIAYPYLNRWLQIAPSPLL
jgi:hypothetical protein